MEELTIQQEAKILAAKKGKSLEKVIMKALNDGLFINSVTDEPYSLSWVKSRIKSGDKRILPKLETVVI